jgi:hypothetical protein
VQQTFDAFVLWTIEHLAMTGDPMGFGTWVLVLLSAAVFVTCAYFAVLASATRMFKGSGPRDWINMAVSAVVAILFALPVLLSLQVGVRPALAAASVKLVHMAVLVPAAVIALGAALVVLAVVPGWRADRAKTRAGLELAGLYTGAMLAGLLFFQLYTYYGLHVEVFVLVDWLLWLVLLAVYLVGVLSLIAMAYFGVRAMLNGFWLDDLHPRLAGVYKTAFGLLFLASVWLLHRAFDAVKAEYGGEVDALSWEDVAAVLPAISEVFAAGVLIVYGLVSAFVEIPGAEGLRTGE